MANGVAAVRLLDHPPSTETNAEIDLGAAVAAATTVLSVVISDYHHRGVLAPATKAASGARLARLAMLQLAHAGGDADFAIKAREAGKRELMQHFATGFNHSPAAVEAVLDGLIGDVLMIVGKTVALERSMAN